MIGEEAIANEDDIQDVQENDDKFNPDKIDRMEIDEWLSIQVQEDNNCEPQSNINFNEITKSKKFLILLKIFLKLFFPLFKR